MFYNFPDGVLQIGQAIIPQASTRDLQLMKPVWVGLRRLKVVALNGSVITQIIGRPVELESSVYPAHKDIVIFATPAPEAIRKAVHLLDL